MRALFGSLVNRFVGNKPSVPPAPFVNALGVPPPGDVRLIGIGHANSEAVERMIKGGVECPWENNFPFEFEWWDMRGKSDD